MTAEIFNANVRQLTFSSVRTYLFAVVFVAGNIVLPQLCHLVPDGGITWLPIYFFTLIAAYSYGWRVGVLTAVLSPVVNNLFFGMPSTGMLPVILVKSGLLAVCASLIARKVSRVSLWAVAAAVVVYQSLGMLAEWAMTSSLTMALQDVRVGFPGILLQIAGGYIVLRQIDRIRI